MEKCNYRLQSVLLLELLISLGGIVLGKGGGGHVELHEEEREVLLEGGWGGGTTGQQRKWWAAAVWEFTNKDDFAPINWTTQKLVKMRFLFLRFFPTGIFTVPSRLYFFKCWWIMMMHRQLVLHMNHVWTEMGTPSWFRVPCSGHYHFPGILGTWARGNANIIQA